MVFESTLCVLVLSRHAIYIFRRRLFSIVLLQSITYFILENRFKIFESSFYYNFSIIEAYCKKKWMIWFNFIASIEHKFLQERKKGFLLNEPLSNYGIHDVVVPVLETCFPLCIVIYLLTAGEGTMGNCPGKTNDIGFRGVTIFHVTFSCSQFLLYHNEW